jgi:hypothetical protein
MRAGVWRPLNPEKAALELAEAFRLGHSATAAGLIMKLMEAAKAQQK